MKMNIIKLAALMDYILDEFIADLGARIQIISLHEVVIIRFIYWTLQTLVVLML